MKAGVTTLSVSVITSAVVFGAWLGLADQAALAGGACRGGDLNDEATTTVIVDEYMCFNPGVVRVEPGATVTWQNPESGVAHAVTGSNLSWGTYDQFAPGASVSNTFAEPGVYPYYCYLHPAMVGAVVVSDALERDGSESVSLAGNDAPLNSTSAASTDSGSVRNLWLIVPAAAMAAIVVGGVSYALGARRAG